MKFIVAHDLNDVIGINNQIPWHFKKDFAFFKFITLGHPCIMGVKTYNEIMQKNPNGLPDREMIVLSKEDIQGVYTIKDTSDEELLKLQKHLNVENLNDVFVIGGSKTYQAFLPFCTEMYGTQILKAYDTKNAMQVARFPYTMKFLQRIKKSEILFKAKENDVDLIFHRFTVE